MKEYEIMEIFIADQKQMRAEDGKQEIYLEWHYRLDKVVQLHVATEQQQKSFT